MSITPETTQRIKNLVSGLFLNTKGDPYQLTDSQAEIFFEIIDPSVKWLWLSGPTRFGKSETLSLAILYLASCVNLKIPIVAGSEEKARKIMDYVLEHVDDNKIVYQGLLGLGVKDIERLKIQRSKQALRWADGGWIYITSVDARTLSREGERVVGEGGDIVILEEAGLIRQKEQYSKIVRMIEGDWGKLIMSGNCIEKSVFEDAYNDPLYKKVKVSLDQAIAEGRINPERLEQQKTQTTSKDWKRYYLVEFPKHDEYAYFKPKSYDYVKEKIIKTVGAVDPALGEAQTGSLVGITILGKGESGQIYELESIGKQLKPNDAIDAILNLPYEFERFGIEDVQFQKYFKQVIDDKSKSLGKYIPFVGIKQSKKKQERIESMEPFVNTGQILFKGNNELWEEMQNYPESEYLDVMDSMEMAWRLMAESDVDFFFA